MNPPMPESVRYLDLPAPEQVKLLHGLAPVLGRRAEILEKDIWLCQVLDLLFALPQRKPMAFKGGTSLSKVCQAMLDAQMFYGDTLSFDYIVQCLMALEQQINQA